MQDIEYLKIIDIKLPTSISKKIISDEKSIYNGNNAFDYIGFDEQYEIDFFNNLDFIVDYREYQNLTPGEIEQKAEQIITLINKISKKYNSMNNKQKKNNVNMLEMINHLQYKFDSIAYAYSLNSKIIQPFFESSSKVKHLKPSKSK